MTDCACLSPPLFRPRAVAVKSVTTTLTGGRPPSTWEILLVKRPMQTIRTGVNSKLSTNVLVLTVSMYSRRAISKILRIAPPDKLDKNLMQRRHLHLEFRTRNFPTIAFSNSCGSAPLPRVISNRILLLLDLCYHRKRFQKTRIALDLDNNRVGRPL